jgi:hypothetical protein
MRGPGVAKCGYLCAQGPTSAFRGQLSFSIIRKIGLV